MLSAGQLRTFRDGVQAAQRRPWAGPWRWARCIDGPLAGLRIRLEPSVDRNPQAIFGWCQMTDRGPVVANYKQTGGEWLFEGYACPGRKESRGPSATDGRLTTSPIQ